MTDDLDDLKSLMQAATPRPDAARRAENLAMAQNNFEALQGSRNPKRSIPVTGPMALWTGVKKMLNTMTPKGGLTATTALVACGFLLMTPQGQDLWRTNPLGDLGRETSVAPKQEEPVFADAGSVASLPAETDSSAAEPVARIEEALPDLRSRDIVQQPQPESAPVVGHATTMAPAPTNPSTQAADRALSITRQSSGAVVAAESMASDAAALTENELVEMMPSQNTEAFANAASNPLKITATDPVSTFSIDVDTASYAVVRQSIAQGHLPLRDAVRVEELINYFPYDYPAPGSDEAPFRPTVTVTGTPWNADTQLVHIAIQGEMPAITDRPALNLVFLIDTSGSMDDPAKLPLLKQSFRLMLDQLRPEDQVAIVAYAGSAGQVLAPTPATERTTILQALDALGAGGSTNGQGGLEQAYATAESMAKEGEISRVILATDGDFNVGVSDTDGLTAYIEKKRDTGTYLSVLGFGRGNLDDATMQALAQNGNGTAAYIDTLSEAQKVLVDQLSGALFPIAGDVKVQVEWNPATVAEYRLIGYETRALNREDFNNDAVDAGELGAGHAVTAIYEITPVGSPAQLSDPLRYQVAEATAASTELGFLKLRYKEPGASTSQLIETPIVPGSGPSTEANFAIAIAGFGQLLRGNAYLGDWSYPDAIALADANKGADPFGYRTEVVQLMRLADSLNR